MQQFINGAREGWREGWTMFWSPMKAICSEFRKLWKTHVTHEVMRDGRA